MIWPLPIRHARCCSISCAIARAPRAARPIRTRTTWHGFTSRLAIWIRRLSPPARRRAAERTDWLSLLARAADLYAGAGVAEKPAACIAGPRSCRSTAARIRISATLRRLTSTPTGVRIFRDIWIPWSSACWRRKPFATGATGDSAERLRAGARQAGAGRTAP